MKTELKVGIFVFVSFIILLIILAYLGRSSLNVEGREYYIEFNSINDLKKGAEVKFGGGILIGYVRDIWISGNKIKMKLWIRKDFQITNKHVFSISAEGVLGEKYINVVYQESDEKLEIFAEGVTIKGKDSVSFNDTLNEIYTLVKSLRDTVDNVNYIVEGLAKKKSIEKISNATVKILSETQDIISQNKENITAILNEVVEGAKGLNVTLNKSLPNLLKTTTTSINKISTNIDESVALIKDILETIKTKESVINTLLYDKESAKNIKTSISNLKKIIDSLEYSLKRFDSKSKDKNEIW
ncbi:MAG TPA: MlaD family protein [Spirochaetota bacterium]|nr:MlaD family protein [Spirochaetota bacterium]HOM38357.1 MlaD family protein [Spirochaetota bacterium]HPQ48425.1 MlaD family protein [Spirochaetota bacterium]